MRFFATLLSLSAAVVAAQAMPNQLADRNGAVDRGVDAVGGLFGGHSHDTEGAKRDIPWIGHSHPPRDDPSWIGHSHLPREDSSWIGHSHLPRE
ncbi:hypothetical protein DENSPDRAFT_832002 [Dentipellis sp. KUC8613]|nr:hypothetical protein DENSPDRAFT_832002 [Dentipellis sp. KUC8613]